MLTEWQYTKENINPELLAEELTAVLGNYFAGISTGGDAGLVRVHVQAGTPKELQDQVQAVMASHDGSQLTHDQQTRADQNAQFTVLKQKSWAEWTAQDKDTLLQLLLNRLEIFPAEVK